MPREFINPTQKHSNSRGTQAEYERKLALLKFNVLIYTGQVFYEQDAFLIYHYHVPSLGYDSTHKAFNPWVPVKSELFICRIGSNNGVARAVSLQTVVDLFLAQEVSIERPVDGVLVVEGRLEFQVALLEGCGGQLLLNLSRTAACSLPQATDEWAWTRERSYGVSKRAAVGSTGRLGGWLVAAIRYIEKGVGDRGGEAYDSEDGQFASMILLYLEGIGKRGEEVRFVGHHMQRHRRRRRWGYPAVNCRAPCDHNSNGYTLMGIDDLRQRVLDTQDTLRKNGA
ncbi:hypothetical protein GALMADRAFT_216242 [Galerina marginata CBS 339.88]|uniref:Uncharacterized protein n=1 Tax=Galerina marginata (strain CBS 339.88) TaxID=685588 RepID=A0A067SLF5_GALM3|nr:hypothetical protein GALMADRAFT_216242 [Galerina marginata CBS 339.88]